MGAFISDLRERRLLPIIALLVVCLIAVPFLLGGGGEEAVPPPPSATAGEPLPGIETRPVVVATPAELRSYKKRLASFRSRNPFHQNLPKPPPDNTGDSGTEDPGTGIPGIDTGSSDSGLTPSSPTSPSSPTTIPPADEGTSGGELITIRIDVKAGRAGNLKTIKNVKALDYLPDPQHPVVQYVGGEFNLSGAAFVVSPGIEATDGDGKCSPSPDNCQFLLMRPGDEQSFIYRAEDYKLRLLEVKRHVKSIDEGDLREREPSETPRGSVRNAANGVEGR